MTADVRPRLVNRRVAARHAVVSTTNKQRFAAIPLRALLDQRLTGHHLRLLGTVAAHDRLGKNGNGCWASQDRLAALLGCSKSTLSKRLSALRDYGYITSEHNPQKRWFRVHRVIYNADDQRFWDTKSVSAREATDYPKSVSAREETNSPNQFPNRAKSVSTVTKLSNENNDLKNVTIVRTIESKKKETVLDGRDCAEARSRPMIDPDHVEDYLTTCEAMAAAAAPTLIIERDIIAEIADDPCLPETLNERAAKLLARIPEGKAP
jgi:DNA-binding MarR family transcriptional regulator